MTAETYRNAGGLPVVRCLEDMAFTDALERLDAQVRRSTGVNVLTSLRVSGRVDIGLSDTLSKWARGAAAGEPLLLRSPDAIAWEALNRRFLRERWHEGCTADAIEQASVLLTVEAEWLAEHWRRARSAGELCQMVCWHHRGTGTGPYSLPKMEVRAAIRELRYRVGKQRALLRAWSVKSVQTDRADIFPPAGQPGAAGFPPWTPGQRFREPDRPSADSRAPRASSEPAAGGRPRRVG